MRVGMLGAEERDARLMLERAAGRNYLDVNPLDLIVGERTLVLGDHLFDNRALADGLVNLAALKMLEAADLGRDAGAGRDEPQNFEINLIHPRAQSLDRRRLGERTSWHSVMTSNKNGYPIDRPVFNASARARRSLDVGDAKSRTPSHQGI